MAKFQIYYENADTDDPRKLIGDVEAMTMGEALHKASQYFEVPSYDLVAVQDGDEREATIQAWAW